eukprot:jgi/Orpsp1_1/1191275/evm.model.d7180000084631.1
MLDPNQMRNPQMIAKKQQLMAGHNLSKQRSMPVVLQNGKQQFAGARYNQQYNQYNQQYPPQYGNQSQSNPNERKWIDKLMDAIVGDVNEVDTKYALVCNYCYTHCGLALPEEYKTFKYICPNCKKLNDNAKKYKIDVQNNKKIVDKDHMLLPPPSAPVEKPKNLNILQDNTFSKSAPVSPRKKSSIVSNNDNTKKPNLERRSSTLLDEMDDSTNTDTTTLNQINQTPVNIKQEDIINEGTDEALDQDTNDINQFEQEIENEKEVINYQEENNNNDNNSNNNNDTIVEGNENVENDEIKNSLNEGENKNNEEVNDNNKQESSISSPVKEQDTVKDSDQTI